MKGLIRLGCVVLCFGSLTGCGDDSSDDEPSNAGGPPISELPLRYSEALCSAYERCFGPVLGIFLAGEDCLTRTTERLEDDLPRFEAAIAAKRITYRASLVEDCTEKVATYTCDDLLQRDTDPCQSVLDGTIQVGAYCAMNEECQGAAYCKFEDACPGSCAELEPEGGRCNSDSNCESGLDCSNETSRCVVPAGPGDLCQAGQPDCRPGYLCAGADADQNRSGNCRTYDEAFAGANGNACDPITGELCAMGQVCRIDAAGADGLVASCAAPVDAGAACNLAFPDSCPAGQYCEIAVNTLSGTCKARPAVGSPCGLTFEGEPQVCAAYARCDGQTCRALGHLGEACTSDDTCYSEHCIGGQCVPSEGCE